MKNLKLLFTVMILFIGLTTTFAKDKKAEVKEVTYTCSVDCHACKEKIMKNIPYEKGVKKVVVDLDQKLVTVAFKEDKNTTENIQKALENLGYEAAVKEKEASKKK
ncbi:heavy-metal-associated domain-containing protein [Plebeiibacterium sediminum]|uniref:Heavy-metal-associated domain-containing protein n=1 Tax=Plebeiibacterium sediminum TaxID=2992112 RepID=A0AAE3M6N0_9BACT|nr:heavy metal-associated domain-containing protein [Plebeiobacterium sediminum]MCW3788104.1 heavy-metal-associated domain-containing protein [Plebeiobacterium sediminum]